jgi:VanZ family protein
MAGMIGLPFAFLGARISLKHPKFGLYALFATFLSFIAVADLHPYSLEAMKAINIDLFIPLIHHFRDPDVMMLANIIEAILVYAPLGFLVYAIRLRSESIISSSSWPSITPAIAACILVGTIIETLQLWIATRVPGLEDVMYATIGGYVGASAAQLFVYVIAASQTQDALDRTT